MGELSGGKGMQEMIPPGERGLVVGWDGAGLLLSSRDSDSFDRVRFLGVMASERLAESMASEVMSIFFLIFDGNMGGVK